MTPTPDFSECLACSCFAARRAARTITQHYERHLKPSGLRVTQFTVLSMLAAAGPQALSRLADQLATERTTLTRNLRSLMAAGLVTESATEDARVRLLAITPRGTAAARAALPYWREAQKSIARRLGGGAIRALAAASAATTSLSPGRPVRAGGR
jgi:DNA-binding MarR family transcriptional regulator